MSSILDMLVNFGDNVAWSVCLYALAVGWLWWMMTVWISPRTDQILRFISC